MKRSSLFLILLVLSACSKPNKKSLFFSQLEKSASSDHQVTQRAIATIDGQKCLKDVFSVSVLKNEIREWEKKYSSGTKVTGKWKHLNLAELSIAQATFLKIYGDRIGDLSDPNAFDFSSCQDVPCLFNKIYGKEDDVAGYVHYLWFLKMGNLLAATNNVYNAKSQTRPGIYNGKAFPVSSYLYRGPELYGFWRLLMMMKEPHTSLADFKEIHRVPQGESFDFVQEKRARGEDHSLGETCGLAYSSGYVLLQDLCLSIYDDWESGDFYSSILHEFSHQVDYHEGRKLERTYRSDKQDYLDVSYFYLKEYKNEKNETVRQWDHRPGIKLVTSYAGTSPAENFAESLSYFRTEADTAKENLSEEHFNFVSKNYYHAKSFTKDVLIEQWLKDQSSYLSQMAFSAVGDCSKSTQVYASKYFGLTDIRAMVLPTMLSCLGAKAEAASVELRSKIKVSDPDGCRVLSDYGVSQNWGPVLKKQIAELMSKYVIELQSDKDYYAKIQSFIDGISDNTLAAEAFLSCGDLAKEETCYTESVQKLALDKLSPLHLPEAHALDLAKMYTEAHPIIEIKGYLKSYYRTFVSSHRSLTDAEAQRLWSQCHSGTISDDPVPSGQSFSVGDGYIVSSIYNCLNTGFSASLKVLIGQMVVGDKVVEHPKEERMLLEEMGPELKESLTNLYIAKRNYERARVKAFILSDEQKIRSQVLGDFSWVKDIINPVSIEKDCHKVALGKITFQLLYDLKGAAFGKYIESACQDIPKSSEFTTWLDQSKSVFKDKMMAGLENRISELAKERAKECVIKFPLDTNVNRLKYKVDREACLVSEWPNLESRALTEFQTDPLVIKFKIDLSTVKTQLDLSRRRKQLIVIKENF